MESSARNEIKVGLFALLGIVLFCASVILLGGDKWFLKRSYVLKVRLPHVTGLNRGSVVSLTGVPVGNVDQVDFIDNTTDVELSLMIQQGVQERITLGSKVSVKTQGALGDKYIYIEPGPLGSQPLKPGEQLDVDRSPDLIDMISSKGSELGEVVQVIKEVRAMFEAINKDGRSQKLMTNLVTGSETFSSTMIELRETMRLMRSEAIIPLASVMKKIDKGQGTLGALINDPSLHNKLTGFLGDAPRNRFLKPIIRDSIQTNEEKSGNK
jgi:phospholipid/cholesterol/gamma-HCH transport system substrate-binding protein